MEICGILGRQPEQKTCGLSVHTGEPGEIGQRSAGCIDSERIASRASEGVKDGSASKIGVVSGEAILPKLTTAVWRKTDLIDRVPCGPAVSHRVFGQEFDSHCGGGFFGLCRACLPNPIPTTAPCHPPPKCTPNGLPESTSLLLAG